MSSQLELGKYPPSLPTHFLPSKEVQHHSTNSTSQKIMSVATTLFLGVGIAIGFIAGRYTLPTHAALACSSPAPLPLSSISYTSTTCPPTNTTLQNLIPPLSPDCIPGKITMSQIQFKNYFPFPILEQAFTCPGAPEPGPKKAGGVQFPFGVHHRPATHQVRLLAPVWGLAKAETFKTDEDDLVPTNVADGSCNFIDADEVVNA